MVIIFTFNFKIIQIVSIVSFFQTIMFVVWRPSAVLLTAAGRRV